MMGENGNQEQILKKKNDKLETLLIYNKNIKKPTPSKFFNPKERYERIFKHQPLTYLDVRQENHRLGVKDKINEC